MAADAQQHNPNSTPSLVAMPELIALVVGSFAGALSAAEIARDKKGPLFRSMAKGDRLRDRTISRFDVLHMIKRRAEAAGLPYSTCCHTFRAHRDYDLSTERRHAGACSGERQSRIAANNETTTAPARSSRSKRSKE